MLAIRFVACLILVFAVALPIRAAPKNFRVGAGCTYATVQAALEAERASPGSPADFIWIARNQTYTAQEIQVHDQNVFIYGGVDDCIDASIGGTTTLSGNGGSARSVMTISGRSQVWLGGLNISQGDNSSTGVGGGINFAGTGFLKIGSSIITNNRSGYGGGINFRGTGNSDDVAQLWINYETQITNNTAGTSGGGIRMEGNSALKVIDPQVWIALNHADGGYGGGIEVVGPATADIGSPGYRFAEYLGLLFQNTAKYGGGLSINGGDGGYFPDASVRLFATDAQHPLRIEQNFASQDGGGIFVRPEDATFQPGRVFVCVSGTRITGNTAREGHALHIANVNTLTTFDFQRQCGSGALGAVVCAGEECNLIDGNVGQDINGQPTGGSTLVLQGDTTVFGDSFSMRGNRGAHAVRVLGNSDYTNQARFSNCLLANNVVTGSLVVADSGTSLGLTNCTIANNQIGTGAVVGAGGILDLFNDIFAQGPITTITYLGGNPANLSIDYVLSMEVASLAQGSHLIQADPSFVSVPSADYRLLPNSLAIDRAPPVTGDDRDLDNNPRDQDSGSVPNGDGVRDLGAYERQARYCGASDTVFCNNFDYD